jgi:hypothetical protein
MSFPSVIVVGEVGTGKTTVAIKIQEALEAAGLPCEVVGVDEGFEEALRTQPLRVEGLGLRLAEAGEKITVEERRPTTQRYAGLAWAAADVQVFCPGMTDAEAIDFLERNSGIIRERACSNGQSVIRDLLIGAGYVTED